MLFHSSLYTSFLLLIIFISCSSINNTSPEKDLIIGEWRLHNTYSDSITDDTLWKCLIFEDKKCKVYPGFYQYNSDGWVTQVDYLGNITNYEIDSQNIKVYNLVKSQWENFSIKKLTLDTLILNSDTNAEFLFLKIKKKQRFKNNFDEVIFINEGINKYRTDYSLLLSKNSTVQIQAYNYNDQYIGQRICQVENALIDSIYNLFNYINILDLETEYYPVQSTDFKYELKQKTIIAFFRDNKVIKEVQVFDNSGPIDLHLAYEPIKSIFNFNRCKCNSISKALIGIQDIIITCDEKKFLALSEAEQFYINRKINIASEQIGKIKDIYKSGTIFSTNMVFSDGRFIREEGNNKIYDVGYWFIDSTKFKVNTIVNNDY